MDKDVVNQMAQASQQGTVPFPEVVQRLEGAGVEYYFVDYAGKNTTYYSAAGDRVAVPLGFDDLPGIAADFNATALRAAILDSQTKGQSYHAFSKRAVAAGVQGYFAFLRGKRVTYLGRSGAQHTEWFPGAAPQRSQS